MFSGSPGESSKGFKKIPRGSLGHWKIYELYFTFFLYTSFIRERERNLIIIDIKVTNVADFQFDEQAR